MSAATANNEATKEKKVHKQPKNKVLNFLYRLLKKKPLGFIGLAILIFLLFVAIFADVLAPQKMIDGVLQTNMIERLQAPSLKHLFGTDSLGRDLLSYMIYGTRTSVIIAICATIISTVISIFIGVTSAVLGGWVDLIVQRFVDAWQCIPGLLKPLYSCQCWGAACRK